MEDSIIVSRLEIWACVGVPAAEREVEQRLTVSLLLEPEGGLAGLGDDIGRTVDYAAVCEVVKEEAKAKPRRLIETLAEEIATRLLKGFALRAVEVEVRKYALPETEHVGVRMRRERLN
jgi:dihydroneopterin aldolase